MRAYVMTTGAVFGLLALAHLWRVIEEGWGVASDPFFILTSLVSAGLCLWALRMIRHAAPR
jgi:hypothetical protein